MKRILFIGTSHLVAVKEGWELLQAEYADRYSASFAGIDAPRFVKSIETGWKAERRARSVVPPPTLAVNVSPDLFEDATTKAPGPGSPNRVRGLTFRLDKFDAVVFVDLFFRYPLNSPLAFDDDLYPSYKGVPVSFDQISTYRLSWVGYQGLSKHKNFGDVPVQDAGKILEMFRNARPDLPLFLLPQPADPEANREKSSAGQRTRNLLRGLDLYYTYTLGRLGIRYLPQPDRSRSPETGLTLNDLSRGPHATRPGMLDPHLNANYGVMAIKEVLQAL